MRQCSFDGDELCGVVEASFTSWNARLTIRDIARECGAGHVWHEVTHINAPAIRAYLRMGG